MKELGYERVIFIPSHTPAHKKVDGDIPPADRLEMTRLALEDYPEFLVESCEILRTGVSYSIDTVSCVYGGYQCQGKAGLIIGDDLVPHFHLWKDADELSSRVDLVVAHRKTQEELPLDYPHTYLHNEIWPVSSSEIRELYRQGADISHLVPRKVIDYIREKGFYKDHGTKRGY